MIEQKLIAARAEAEKDIEPLLRTLRHMLIETYMAGFMKGIESCEQSEDVLVRRFVDEEEAIRSG